MGTNYYLATSKKEAREKYLRNYTLTDEPAWAYEIHIAKDSIGWIPLFQAHDGAFNSYKELRALVETGDFILYDGSHHLLSWQEFDSIIQSKMDLKEDLQSHLGRNSVIPYYKDLEGYEFTHGEFS